MFIDFDEDLCRRFPKLYRDRHAPMMDTCMCWGFPHGDGWNKVIYRASERLEFLSNLNLGVTFVADQVKEKFGTLRFYIHPEFDDKYEDNGRGILADIGYSIASEAEVASVHKCQLCGKRGTLRQEGWLITLCDEHYNEREARYNGAAEAGQEQ
jgi:hypothetical protein